MSDLSWLNPTPHAIAVYASQPTSPLTTQTLATKRTLLLTWAGLPPAGSHQLCLAHSFDHLIGEREQRILAAWGFVSRDQRLRTSSNESLDVYDTLSLQRCDSNRHR